jgi:hypothetical protein
MNMDIIEQRICAWSGIVFLLLFGLGWVVIAQFLPPHSPSASADAIAAIYQQNTVRIRVGLAVGLFGAAFVVPFYAAIGEQMKRLSGGRVLLANIQLVCGSIAILMVFTVPMMAWETIAFRPDRPAEISLAISDFAWLMFAMTLSPFFIQFMAIALAIFLGDARKAVFPRWAAYFNVWGAMLVAPAGVIAMFHTGPFAWNGLLAFWLPVAVFCAWVLIMFFLLLRAIKLQALEQST